MRKYLIKGALALFAGTFVFSCAENAEKDENYVPVPQQKTKAFVEVFKEVYGEIAPDHNWGFSTAYTIADESTSEVVYIDSVVTESAMARTRAGRTRTANPEANLWGRYYTNVPDPLTPAQKKRVRLYFQYNRYPTNEPVSYTNFFVQDVYKGATTPLNDGSADKSQYSTEKYQLNGQQEPGSNHMDYLTAGPKNDHIYNYNNAKCSTNNEVWDGRTYQTGYPLTAETAAAQGIGDWEAENFNHVVYHSDEIMLMENSSTACFGWHETVGDIHHNDQYVIISGATIDAWAAQHSELGDLGESVTGRGFVGFDYERVVDLSTLLESEMYYSDAYPEGIHYISNARHTYGSVEVQPDANGRYPAGSYPVYQRYVDGSNNTVNIWVKPTGCADGYYSDWIVCIVQANGKNITTRNQDKPQVFHKKHPIDPQCGRIFCEDLGVSSREDLDFNDVVFDVDIYMHWDSTYTEHYLVYSDGRKETLAPTWSSTIDHPTYTAEIKLLAAGGTLPLTVAGTEVHSAFGVGITTMVNTHDDNSTAFGSFEDCDPVSLGVFTPSQIYAGVEGVTDGTKIYAIDIPIVVQYTTNINELRSQLGGAPAKLFVPNHSTKWTVERKPLSLAYPKFADYVGNKTIEWWNDNLLSSAELDRAIYYRYNKVSYTSAAKPPIVITRISYPLVTQDNLWTTSLDFGSWGLYDINLSVNKFYAGDRIIFEVDNLTADSYMTVVFADGSKPYFIDTVIRNFDLDDEGNKIYKTSGVLEVTLDETNAEKLNKSLNNSLVPIQIQGRSFTLTRIGRTLFQ